MTPKRLKAIPYAQAQDLPIGWIKPGLTSYILAKLKDKTKKDDVVKALRELLRDKQTMNDFMALAVGAHK